MLIICVSFYFFSLHSKKVTRLFVEFKIQKLVKTAFLYELKLTICIKSSQLSKRFKVTRKFRQGHWYSKYV